MNLSSSLLVSNVPTTSTVGGPELRAVNASRRGRAASSSLNTPVESVRAPASMRAIGTGCDQRVGGVGLEIYTRLGAEFGERAGVGRAATPESNSALVSGTASE
jgi:hypothetical protein